MDASHREPEYDEVHMRFLELVWGDGFLSPGGPEEVRRILENVDLSGKTVLDLGCGSGGITIQIAREFSAAYVVGFDVEEPCVQRARAKAHQAGLGKRVNFVQADPGPLPFPEASFDLVFSKDAMVHIPNKEALLAEIFRVLKPGGVLAASDWMISHDGPPSADMQAYLEAEGLSFGMASPARYESAMKAAGFEGVITTSRNAWYRDEAQRELQRMQTALYDTVVDAVGQSFVQKNIRTWTAMQKVLDSGEHCPTHLRARKPGPTP